MMHFLSTAARVFLIGAILFPITAIGEFPRITKLDGDADMQAIIEPPVGLFSSQPGDNSTVDLPVIPKLGFLPTETQALYTAGSDSQRPADVSEMVYIPAGEFQMGCDDTNPNETCYSEEQPLHAIFLDSYYMDLYEVTNAQYAECVNAGVCDLPSSTGYYNDPAYSDHPVSYVSWHQANDYCSWAGKRLPTEAEWEKAARGDDDIRIFPWGDQAPDCTLANYNTGSGMCVGGTTPVGSYPSGASPYGILDIAGNVWEWVYDWYDPNYYAHSPYSNPTGPITGTLKIRRGGGYLYGFWEDVRVAFRAERHPDYNGNHVGFRCASDGDGSGVIYEGRYRNLFDEFLGHSGQEVMTRKIMPAWNQLFYGGNDERVYYEVGSNMGYILDPSEQSIKSEGMSYGMMIAVQMGKQEVFNRLWNFAKMKMQHKNGPREGYFAWHIKASSECTDDPGYDMEDENFIAECVLDINPAPDGEEYIAMALLFASGRWGDGDYPYDYQQQAREILYSMTRDREFPVTPMFRSGLEPNPSPQVVFTPYENSAQHTDPSYHLPAFYELWDEWGMETNQNWTWRDTTFASRRLLYQSAHPGTGLTPDYAQFDGSPITNDDYHDDFRHDAWRVAMNIAVDYSWFREDSRQLAQSNRLLRFFNNEGVYSYGNQYTIDGEEKVGNDHSTGLVSMNAVAALAATDSDIAYHFVNDLWVQDIPTGEYRYYDGLLYLLGLLHVSGNFRIYQPVPSTSNISSSSGGEVLMLMGTSYEAAFPPGSVSEPVTVTMGIAESQPLANSVADPDIPILENNKLIGKAFFIEAVDSIGNPVTTFTEPFTVTIKYNGVDVQNINESSLTLNYWDENIGQWQEIPTTIDADENSISATLDHLTIFALYGEPQYLIYLPLTVRQ